MGSPTGGEGGGTSGYRIVRLLGTGSRSSVYLGRAPDDLGAPALPEAVALKVVADQVTDEELGAEILACENAADAAALRSTDAVHVVRLLDVASDGTGRRALVFERLEGGSLATLLRTRERIRAGEAATIIISVFRGVHDLHHAGWTHNALSASTVLLDRAGRPVIIALGHATPILKRRRPSEKTGDDAVAEDWRRVRTLVTSVLDHTDSDSRRSEALEIHAAVDRLIADPSPSTEDAVEDAAFAFAQPAPIVPARPSNGRCDLDGDVAREVRMSRAQATSSSSERDRSDVGTVATERGGRRRAGTVIREQLAAAMEGGVTDRLLGKLRGLFQRHRRPVLVAAALAAVIGVGALAALPPSAAKHAGGEGGAADVPTATSSPQRPATSPAPHAPTTGDDPVEAAALLLAVRARCLSGGRPSCLEQTDQADSAIAADDLARLRAGRPTAAAASATASAADLFDRDTFALSLVERTGDSALIEITPRPDDDGDGDGAAQTKPASVLVIKGEAGWRLRAVFAA